MSFDCCHFTYPGDRYHNFFFGFSVPDGVAYCLPRKKFRQQMKKSHEVKVVPFELKCQYSPDLLQQSLKQASTSLAFRRDRQVLARYCHFNDYSRIPSALEYCDGYVVTQQRRREISCTFALHASPQ